MCYHMGNHYKNQNWLFLTCECKLKKIGEVELGAEEEPEDWSVRKADALIRAREFRPENM